MSKKTRIKQIIETMNQWKPLSLPTFCPFTQTVWYIQEKGEKQ